MGTVVMSSNGYDSDDTNSLKIGSEEIDIVTSTGAFLAQEYERDFSRLDQDAVVDAYKASKRRVIIFDLNGTIVPKEPPGKYFKLGVDWEAVKRIVVPILSKFTARSNGTVVK